MLAQLYMAGWEISEGPILEDYTLNFTMFNPDIPLVWLSIDVYINEIPAIVSVHLMDENEVLDDEWQDTEIDADEITKAAKKLSDYYQEDEDEQ